MTNAWTASLLATVLSCVIGATQGGPPVEEFLDLNCHKSCLQPFASLSYDQLFCRTPHTAKLRQCNKKCMLQKNMEDYMFNHAYNTLCLDLPPNAEPRRRKVNTLIDSIAQSLGAAGGAAGLDQQPYQQQQQQQSAFGLPPKNGLPPVSQSSSSKFSSSSSTGGGGASKSSSFQQSSSSQSSQSSSSFSSSSSSAGGKTGGGKVSSSFSSSSSGGSLGAKGGDSKFGVVRTSNTRTGPNGELITETFVKQTGGDAGGMDVKDFLNADSDSDSISSSTSSKGGIFGAGGFSNSFGSAFGGAGDWMKQAANKAKQSFGFGAPPPMQPESRMIPDEIDEDI